MQPGGDSTTNSYPGHVFCFVAAGNARGCAAALGTATMTPEVCAPDLVSTQCGLKNWLGVWRPGLVAFLLATSDRKEKQTK